MAVAATAPMRPSMWIPGYPGAVPATRVSWPKDHPLLQRRRHRNEQFPTLGSPPSLVSWNHAKWGVLMHEDEPTIGQAPSGGDASTVRPAEGASQLRPGDQVGRYKILEQIGEGGFAVGTPSQCEGPL